jgi:putative nucleotidyltransferase with HDIG domain
MAVKSEPGDHDGRDPAARTVCTMAAAHPASAASTPAAGGGKPRRGPALDEALQLLASLVREVSPRDGVWLVGGAVRDALLGREAVEADLAVAGDVEAFAEAAAAALGTRCVPLGREQPLWRLPLAGGHLDIVALKGTLHADLAGRDFTVNALAVALADLPAGGCPELRPADLVDPLGGATDLEARRLRLAGPEALRADPLRALRAVRLACELDFALDAVTERSIREALPGLDRVAPERVGAELRRIFATPRAARGVRLMDATGLLDACLPPLAVGRGVTQRPLHRYDVLEHQLVAVEWMDVLLAEQAPPDGDAARIWRELWVDADWGRPPWGSLRDHFATHAPALRLATLLHDAGKPATRTVEADGRTRFFGHAERGAEIAGALLRRWRFPAAEVRRVELLVAQHLRPGQLTPPGEAATPRALHRFHRALGDATPDVCWLFLADSLATAGAPSLLPRWGAYVAHVRRIVTWAPPAEARAVARLVDGHAVMHATGLPPGPEVGRILAAIEEAAVAGEVRSPEQALALAVTLAEQR